MRRCLTALALAVCVASAEAETLAIDGEVFARRSAMLIPPRVSGAWNFTITRIAPDGAPVETGDVVIAFDANSLVQKLTAQKSKLAEKNRELEKLLLDLDERARSEQLNTAEARADLEKAQRKTEQPEELVAGIEYRKLVVARKAAEKHLALTERREQLAAEQRRQERRLLESEIADARREVQRLQAEIASLNLTAPRDGLLMHRSGMRGEKFDVGTKVWIGQTIAEIPDSSTLAVRAELPERELSRVRKGASARVVLEGGAGIAVRGKVTSIGRTVRSKSRVQPVPVLDMEIALDDPAADLRPGQAVRVQLTPDEEER